MDAKFWLCPSCSEWNSEADKACLKCGCDIKPDAPGEKWVKCDGCGAVLKTRIGLGVSCAGCKNTVSVPIAPIEASLEGLNKDPVWEDKVADDAESDKIAKLFLSVTGSTPVCCKVLKDVFYKTTEGHIIISALVYGKTEVTMKEFTLWVKNHPAKTELLKWLIETIKPPTPSGPISSSFIREQLNTPTTTPNGVPSPVVVIRRDPNEPLGMHLDDETMKLVSVHPESPSDLHGLSKYIGQTLTHAAGRSVFTVDNVIEAAHGCGSVLVRFINID